MRHWGTVVVTAAIAAVVGLLGILAALGVFGPPAGSPGPAGTAAGHGDRRVARIGPNGVALAEASASADAAGPAGSNGSGASGDAAATRGSTAGSAGADRWAVLVGISHYEGNTHPTYGGDGDVAAFQTLLQRAGWPSNHVLVLTDANATMGNMVGAMQWLVSHSSAGSFTLFHYSGHVCEQGRGPCSGSHKFLWSVDNQLMSDTRFGQIMGGLQGSSWIDVAGCEAAAFDQGLSGPERFFTASSMANETSYEQPQWGESIWTGTMVDQGMLQGKAGSRPISIQQAARWAEQQVPQMTAGQSAGTQHPYAVGGTGEWHLEAANPAAAPPPASPPPSAKSGSGGSSSGGGNGNPPPGPSILCDPATATVIRCSPA